jgi:hypothetical protein
MTNAFQDFPYAPAANHKSVLPLPFQQLVCHDDARETYISPVESFDPL